MRNDILVPNGLRVPENLLRIDHLFDRGQSRICGSVIIQTMCLCCREAGVNVIHISTKDGLRLPADNGIIQPIHESSQCLRERLGVADAPIVLEHPEAAAVGIGG